MLSDLRFACRALARARGFSSVVVLTLALGIGSAAAIFSVADWVLFRANKFPDDVFLVGGQADGGALNQWRPAFLGDAYATHDATVSEWGKASYRTGNIVLEGQPVGTSWTALTPNLLPMLGITPFLGRNFHPEEAREGADQVVILSDWFWRQRLGAREDVIGRKIRVGDAICTIVGVLPPASRLPGFIGGPLLRPLVYQTDPKQPWAVQLQMYARLRPGATREQLQAAIRAMKIEPPGRGLELFFQKDRAVVAALGELQSGYRPEIYRIMVGAVAFLYAIACLNASNLMLVRMLGQRRELSVRLALGGTRWQVIRLLWLESVVLATLGALAGIVVANWFFPLLMSATGGSGRGSAWLQWSLNWRVMGVMTGLAAVTSVVIAALPAWRVLRTDINSGLKDGGAALGESPALARLRGGLVVLQTLFAVVLLAGAGLMIQTFRNFQKIELGFSPAGLVKIQLQLSPSDYGKGAEAMIPKLQAIEDELKRVDGVRAAGFGSDVVLPGYTYRGATIVTGDGREADVMFGGFDAGYREAAGLQLLRGRWLEDTTSPEGMVSASLAKTLWPDQDPIGQIVRYKGDSKQEGVTVVGVVGDVRTSMRTPAMFLHQPVRKAPWNISTFLLRLNREYDEPFGSLVRRRLYAFDSRVIVHNVTSAAQMRDQQLWAERMANSVLIVLAGVALFLTIVGVFSVLAYTVDRRMTEFGVRLALGATSRDLVGLVMKRGLLLASLGIVGGIAGALGLSRFLKSLLFETTGNDPRVLGAVAVLLVAAAVLACAWPARRAARVDVARLLRSE